jgi:hypothetical protein
MKVIDRFITRINVFVWSAIAMLGLLSTLGVFGCWRPLPIWWMP